jgi:hypothetical protein
MKRVIYLSAFLLLKSFAFSQTTEFSQEFIGNWKGILQWMVAGKATQTFTMQLRIQPADTVRLRGLPGFKEVKS